MIALCSPSSALLQRCKEWNTSPCPMPYTHPWSWVNLVVTPPRSTKPGSTGSGGSSIPTGLGKHVALPYAKTSRQQKECWEYSTCFARMSRWIFLEFHACVWQCISSRAILCLVISAGRPPTLTSFSVELSSSLPSRLRVSTVVSCSRAASVLHAMTSVSDHETASVP